jgi:hypothetical protein
MSVLRTSRLLFPSRRLNACELMIPLLPGIVLTPSLSTLGLAAHLSTGTQLSLLVSIAAFRQP